jgi:L-asparaginase II
VAHATVDGCGAPLFGNVADRARPCLHRLATAPHGTPAAAVAAAMREQPTYVGGDPHPHSDAMRCVPGLLAKGGAEGVIGIAATNGVEVAVRVADGNPRATTLIALSALAAVGVDVSAASSLLEVPVLGSGRRVGEIVLGADLAALLSGGSAS